MSDLPSLLRRLGLVAVMAGSGGNLPAITPQEAEESSVRIFMIDTVPRDLVDKKGSPVLNKEGKPIKIARAGFGSGFVVSNQGHVVTNQHVVDDLKNNDLEFWVAHKEGKQVKVYHVPRKGRLWTSTNQDLALIQAPDLHCRALALSFFDPPKGMEVYTEGYPGISDTSEGQDKFVEHLRSLIGKVEVADITDFLAKDRQLASMVEPTFTSGHITRLSAQPGFDKGGGPVIELIDQDIKTGHGNSGGPLINPCGEVIGVVGRGKANATDTVKWGIRTQELKGALVEFKVPFTTAAAACTQMTIAGGPSQTKFIFLVGAAVVIAGAALALALIKTKSGTPVAVSYTRVIEAKFKELMGRQASPHAASGSPAMARNPSGRPLPATRSDGSAWRLAGHTPDGRNVRLELTDDLFTRNGNRLVVGRSADLAHLRIDDSSVSRQHAQIRRSGSGLFIADRNSANGTFRNDTRLREPHQEESVQETDTITFGEVKLVLQRA